MNGVGVQADGNVDWSALIARRDVRMTAPRLRSAAETLL